MIVASAIVGFTGWYVWSSKKNADNAYNSATQISANVPKYTSIKTFDECKKSASSKVLKSYPEVCVTAAGQKFNNPDQKPVPKNWTWFESKNPIVKFAYPENWTSSNSNELANHFTVTDDSKFSVENGCGGCDIKYDNQTGQWRDELGLHNNDSYVTTVAKLGEIKAYLIPIKGELNCGTWDLAIHFSHYIADIELGMCAAPEDSDDFPPSDGVLPYEEVVRDLKTVLQTLSYT